MGVEERVISILRRADFLLIPYGSAGTEQDPTLCNCDRLTVEWHWGTFDEYDRWFAYEPTSGFRVDVRTMSDDTAIFTYNSRQNGNGLLLQWTEASAATPIVPSESPKVPWRLCVVSSDNSNNQDEDANRHPDQNPPYVSIGQGRRSH